MRAPERRGREDRRGILRDQRGAGDAFDAPAELDDEQQRQRGVERVLEHGERQHRAHALAPDEPSHRDIEQQRGRRAPDAHQDVVARQLLHARAALENAEREGGERKLQGHDRRADREREQGAAQRDVAQFLVIAGAVRLGDEARRRHAQEAEAPIDVGEEQRAERDAADIGGIGQMAHHRRIDRAHERDRQIGKDDRQRQPEDAAEACGVLLPRPTHRKYALSRRR